MDYIQLNKGSVQRFGIKDKDGNDTGLYIEIDPEDIEFSFRANECQNRHINNVEKFKAKIKEIDENCSNEGEFPTQRDIERLNASKEFMKEEEETIDAFIGEGTTRKLLNGRKPYILMFNDIIEALSQIAPTLLNNTKSILDEVREKYKKQKEDENVI